MGSFTAGSSLLWRTNLTVICGISAWVEPYWSIIYTLWWILADHHLHPTCVLYVSNRRQFGINMPGQYSIQTMSSWSTFHFFSIKLFPQTLLKIWSLILGFLFQPTISYLTLHFYLHHLSGEMATLHPTIKLADCFRIYFFLFPAEVKQ